MFTEALNNPRILIVDDEPGSIASLRTTLEECGYTFISYVSDPQRTLEMVALFDPDLVMVSLGMKPTDGIEVMRRIFAIAPAEGMLPVIVLADGDQGEAIIAALQAGANDVLARPFDTAETSLRVRNALTNRVLRMTLAEMSEALDEQVAEKTRELEDAQLDILECLAKLSEYRDDSTHEHTRRVGDLASLIAEELGLTDRDVKRIKFAARLHDLGKAAISESILLKPGRLTPEERQVMAAHTTIGAELLEGNRSRLLALAEEIARTHHERWDGGGYPLGLEGEQIPLSGRIVAVADVFDVLTHERPYKEAWPVERAIEEIKALSGTQFDPTVVAALLQVLSPGHRLPNERPEGDCAAVTAELLQPAVA